MSKMSRRSILLAGVLAAWLTVSAAAVEEVPVLLEDLLPESGEAAVEPEYPTGVSGDATWTLKDGTMYITGQGILSGPANADCHPWEYFEDQIRHVVVEDGITVVGNLAFAHTYQLETVTIADSVTEICEGAFRNCCALKSVKLPAKLETLGNFTFAYCEKLEAAELPDSMTEMGGSVFTGCSSLSEVRLPSDLYDIRQMNFDACMSLTEVTIPAGVGFLRHSSFSNCFNLKKVVFEGDCPNTNGDPFYMAPEDLAVYCYSDAGGWEEELFYTYSVVKLDRVTGLPATGETGEDRADKPSGGEENAKDDEEIPGVPLQSVESFTDIVREDAFYDAIAYVAERGIMRGISETIFDRRSSVSNQDIFGALEMTGADTAAARGWAAEQRLEGAAAAAREDVITMLWFANGKQAADETVLDKFTDTAAISAESRIAMAWAVEQGIIKGYSSGHLGPQARLTRGAMAAILFRAFGG